MKTLYRQSVALCHVPTREDAMSATTIDPAEVAKFEAMAAEWWDPAGKFRRCT
jgi:2-polyprenyl-3-methyl-5-hydroxy-6-metoxy-1,4-benzoquinol methylase